MHAGGTGRSGNLGHDQCRIPVAHHQRTPEGVVEGVQGIHQVGPTHITGGLPQGLVDHEQGQHLPIDSSGLDQGRVIREAQVAAKPHHSGHSRQARGQRQRHHPVCG